jgi:hypothetical protein
MNALSIRLVFAAVVLLLGLNLLVSLEDIKAEQAHDGHIGRSSGLCPGGCPPGKCCWACVQGGSECTRGGQGVCDICGNNDGL